MAENKKSFIMYCDWIHTIEKLDDNQAGKLFKHLMRYVNDKNPNIDDLLINIAFEPMKQQLKRDLRKYEALCDKNRDNAMKRWHPSASERIPSNAKHADTDNDIDNDIVIENEDIIQTIWIKSFGRNPKLPEQEVTQQHINKFGEAKTTKIYKDAIRQNFHSVFTLDDAIDDDGNIKPKQQNNGLKPVLKKPEMQALIKEDSSIFSKYTYIQGLEEYHLK